MRFAILFSQSRPNSTRTRTHLRTLFDGTFKPVRDRGLDHAVEREKNLKPLINLKNLIILEPSKSLPISVIVHNRESLKLPFRPIEFVRKYPSFFQEFLPAAGTFQPHVRLTAEALGLDEAEKLMHQSFEYKEQLANRVLKLLMISRTHTIPLKLVECLRWDLGLPRDYERSVIPEFPDCFRVVDGRDGRVLELVCWSDELAISVMEKKKKSVKGKEELVFPVQFSSGFEMDKKYEKWLSEWQKLAYVSPYENAAHLPASRDESDRWVVGVLHEILHILVPKKTEKDNLLLLGEWLGLRSRFKRALLQHPGIFYVSSKIGTYTVVLREGYKRGSLIEHHPLMNLRSQYVNLMNTVKQDSKTSKAVQGKSTATAKESNDKDLEGRGAEGDENGGEERRETDEAEGSGDDFDDDEEKSRRGTRKTAGSSRGRQVGKMNLNVLKKPLRNSRRERSAGEFSQKTWETNPSQVSKRIQMRGGHEDVESSQQRPRSPKSRGRLLNSKKTPV